MPPCVSIGMPVYNGENYMREALNSILSQSFEDFELIISDNCSTDKTQEICKAYAVKDSRIRYYRNKKNIGAAKNYNRVFELSSGRYFKWAPHDDICAPEYLEKCVQVLNVEPTVVLCYPKTLIKDELSNREIKYSDSLNITCSQPHERYKKCLEALRGINECNPILGVIRAKILKRTRLIGSYVASDQVLLGELALYGKFYEIPEYLFIRRSHPQRSMIKYHSSRSRLAWFAPEKKGKLQLAPWILFFEYLRAINRAPIDRQKKRVCYLQMQKWLIWNWKWLAQNLIKGLLWPFLPQSLKTKSRKEAVE